MRLMLGKSLVATKSLIFLLYFHKGVIFNMLIEILKKVLRSEGYALPECRCLANSISLCSPGPSLFRFPSKLDGAPLCAPEALTPLNSNCFCLSPIEL